MRTVGALPGPARRRRQWCPVPRSAILTHVGDHQGFTIVLRGYDIGEVEEAMERVRTARASLDPALRAAVRRELTSRTFRIRMRGYDRAQVDEYFRQAIDRLT